MGLGGHFRRTNKPRERRWPRAGGSRGRWGRGGGGPWQHVAQSGHGVFHQALSRDPSALGMGLAEDHSRPGQGTVPFRQCIPFLDILIILITFRYVSNIKSAIK